jgi:hypothetical protein
MISVGQLTGVIRQIIVCAYISTMKRDIQLFILKKSDSKSAERLEKHVCYLILKTTDIVRRNEGKG